MYFPQYSAFLLKDLRFEHGSAKLASCPGRYLTLLRPCRCCRISLLGHNSLSYWSTLLSFSLR